MPSYDDKEDRIHVPRFAESGGVWIPKIERNMQKDKQATRALREVVSVAWSYPH